MIRTALPLRAAIRSLMNHSVSVLLILIATMMVLASCATGVTSAPNPAHPRVIGFALSLDSFHAAASRADFDGYFGAFAPDGVFLGTDATERWTVEEFKAYCKPYFDQGKGWTYLPRQRHISVNGNVAWADEVLENEKYGLCRGTAYLIHDPSRGWLISRYSLAFLIPNAVAAEATALGKK